MCVCDAFDSFLWHPLNKLNNFEQLVGNTEVMVKYKWNLNECEFFTFNDFILEDMFMAIKFKFTIEIKKSE